MPQLIVGAALAAGLAATRPKGNKNTTPVSATPPTPAPAPTVPTPADVPAVTEADQVTNAAASQSRTRRRRSQADAQSLFDLGDTLSGSTSLNTNLFGK